MIKYVAGNAITLFKEGSNVAFAHGCNCMCKMARGIALSVKNELPPLYHVDQRTAKGDRTKLGGFSWANFPWGKGYNLYTQYTWNNPDDMLSLDAVECAFNGMFQDMLHFDIKTVYMPKIGSGLAKGYMTQEQAWSEVVTRIQKVLPKQITVVVVNYKPSY